MLNYLYIFIHISIYIVAVVARGCSMVVVMVRINMISQVFLNY